MRTRQRPLIAQVPPPDPLHDGLDMEGVVVPHLGHAARRRRLDANVKLIRVAYLLDRSEATLSRFERGEVQPADVDAVVLAYARELELNPLELWADALALAREQGVSDEFDEPVSERDESAVLLPRPLPGVSDRPTKRAGRAAKRTSSAGTKRATG